MIVQLNERWQAVQYHPGVELPGLMSVTDDKARRHQWPQGTALIWIGPSDDRGYHRPIFPGQWLLTAVAPAGVAGARKVVSDRVIRASYEAVEVGDE